MFETYLNKLEKKIAQISGRDYKARLLSPEGFLVGISIVYGLCIKFWHRLYQKGILKQKKLPCAVVSIGNIVVGGAGKTPMTIYVANLLKEMGKKPVVISRGYKGRYKVKTLIVSDGDRIFSDAGNVGDEPFMMAKQRSFPVVVGKDRYKAGLTAIEAFHPDVIVLDDGFQHLRLKRDLDILLFDYFNPLGNNRLLPAGRLREALPGSGLRADAVVFTRSPQKDESQRRVKALLRLYPHCPWFKTFHKPVVCWTGNDDEKKNSNAAEPGMLNGKKAVLFSGIANNDFFFQSIVQLNVNVLHHLEFMDHYRYKRSDILQINQVAEQTCADLILTTEKDWAKLDPGIKWSAGLVVMGIQLAFEDPEKFKRFLISKLEKR